MRYHRSERNILYYNIFKEKYTIQSASECLGNLHRKKIPSNELEILEATGVWDLGSCQDTNK